MNLGILLAPSASPRTSSLRSVHGTITRIASRVSATVAEFRAPVPATDLAALEPDTSEFLTVEACLIENCDGYGHPELCTRYLEKTTIGGDLELSTELVVGADGRHISVFGIRDFNEALLVRATTRQQLLVLAAEFADVAKLIERAVDELPEDVLDGGQVASRAYAMGR
jgi:hypothetical protein